MVPAGNDRVRIGRLSTDPGAYGTGKRSALNVRTPGDDAVVARLGGRLRHADGEQGRRNQKRAGGCSGYKETDNTLSESAHINYQRRATTKLFPMVDLFQRNRQ